MEHAEGDKQKIHFTKQTNPSGLAMSSILRLFYFHIQQIWINMFVHMESSLCQDSYLALILVSTTSSYESLQLTLTVSVCCSAGCFSENEAMRAL